MERVHIRTMLNHLKMIQTMDKDVDIDTLFAQLQIKNCIDYSGIPAQRDVKDNLNQDKYGRYTIDFYQHSIKGNTVGIKRLAPQKGNSEPNKISEQQRKKQKLNIPIFQNFKRPKVRSQSENLYQLGIKKKVIGQREIKRESRLIKISHKLATIATNQNNLKHHDRSKNHDTRSTKHTIGSCGSFQNDLRNTYTPNTQIINFNNQTKNIKRINLIKIHPNKIQKPRKQSFDEPLCPWDSLNISINSIL